MALNTDREDVRSPLVPRQAPPSEGRREPVKPVEDELGLFGLGEDPREDQLARQDLSSKPEDYFSCDPQHFHHEVL